MLIPASKDVLIRSLTGSPFTVPPTVSPTQRCQEPTLGEAINESAHILRNRTQELSVPLDLNGGKSYSSDQILV